MAVDLQKAIARLKPAQVRTIIDAALRVEPDDFDDLPAPQVMLRGDGWTGVTTTIDGDGYRAVLITAGGRRTSSRTCTVIDPEGATIGAFSADDAARIALATAAGLLAPRLVGTGPITLGVLGAGPLARRTIAELAGVVPDTCPCTAAVVEDLRGDAVLAVEALAVVVLHRALE